jgi:hypothetical protein
MTPHGTKDDEARIAELLQDGLPAARDPLFRLDVLARRERERFRRELVVALTRGPLTATYRLVVLLFTRMTQTLSRVFVD